jgi:hypothetical protein
MKKEIEKLTAVLLLHKPGDPMHAEALRSRAEVLARVGRHREALEDALKYTQLTRPDSSFLLFCACQKMAIGDLEGSLADANRALASAAESDQMSVLAFRSRLLRHLGKDEAADRDAELVRRMSGE